MTTYIYTALDHLPAPFQYLISGLILPCKSGESRVGEAGRHRGTRRRTDGAQLLGLQFRGLFEGSKFISLQQMHCIRTTIIAIPTFADGKTQAWRGQVIHKCKRKNWDLNPNLFVSFPVQCSTLHFLPERPPGPTYSSITVMT